MTPHHIGQPRHSQAWMKIGIDLGGSLIKICVWRAHDLKPYVLEFFKSGEADAVLRFLEAMCTSTQTDFFLTGGGAKLFLAKLRKTFGGMCRFFFVDEMHALNTGLGFCLEHVEYPTLVVNIGSGVSILQVASPGAFTRVGGSSLGGGTFMGLSRLLTGITNFEQLKAMAEVGVVLQNEIDLTVGDIYAGGYDAIGLQASVVASSFGAVSRIADNRSPRQEAIVFSLLRMISFNVAQLAAILAQRLCVNKICILGGFTDTSVLAQKLIEEGIQFWARGEPFEVSFGHHSMFAGCIGAALSTNTVCHTDDFLGNV